MITTISTENLLKGLNIGLIDVEPVFEEDDYFAYRNKNWSWEDGPELGLTCHLEVYAKEDFSFDVYIENIVVIDDDSNEIQLSEDQKRRLQQEIQESIQITTLQA